MNNKKSYENLTLPIVYLRNAISFPNIEFLFDVGREKSKEAVDYAIENKTPIVLVLQKEEHIDCPAFKNIYHVGVLAEIIETRQLPDDIIQVKTKGLARIEINSIDDSHSLDFANATPFDEELKNADPITLTALHNTLLESIHHYNNLTHSSLNTEIENIKNSILLCDIIATEYLENVYDKQKILEMKKIEWRLEFLIEKVMTQVEILNLQIKINKRVKEQIEKNQRDFYLSEQIKSIQEELGNSTSQEIDKMKQQLDQLPLGDEIKEKMMYEINRLGQIPMGSPEIVVSRTYIEYILSLPWGKFTKDELSIQHAKSILDKHHYGLEKVKERIIEFIAVLHKKKNMRGPILCFVGPPGVGKTSIVRAIAETLGRKFIQMSLGGVRDEAEIRGHRKTYVSAIPGRIVSGIKQAGSFNPLFLFDEIDKLSSDFRGDPASALLEVLDAEQNFAFRDHYLEIPLDLSNVMFITTANSLDTIPPALLDRLEIIEVSSYTLDEKLHIAQKHLLPKQLKEHGLTTNSIKISNNLMEYVIEHYTKESGVRNLERNISKMIRKSILEMAETSKKTLTLTQTKLIKYLGQPKFIKEKTDKESKIGVVNGLAYTQYGGELLNVECITMEGTGKLHLTGKLGEVMKESANASLSWIKANANILNIDSQIFNHLDIHIHVPEGAVPKDGPSAGITITCALISALAHKKVRQDVAMTGEITLRGNVIAIGGLKEKLFAAYRNDIKTVLIPKQNLKDIDEIPESIHLNVIPVDSINNALNYIFEG